MLGDLNPKELRVTVEAGVIYPGLDHTAVATVDKLVGRQYEPVDFSAVTRMLLVLPGYEPAVVIDSAYLPDVITWAGNKITIDLSSYDIPPSVHNCSLVAFDAQHPRGQAVVDGVDSRMVLDFRDIITGGSLPPPIGDQTTMVREAGATMSALKVVYELNGVVYPLDKDDAAHIDLLLGVTLTAADMGGTVTVQRTGFIDDSSWSWTPGRVYLGAAGALTQVPATSGSDVLIGSASSATRLILGITDPITLE